MNGRNAVKKILAIFALYMFSFAGIGDVLLWTVDGDATVDRESSVYTFLSPVPDDDLHNPAARIKISGGGLSSPIYLDNYWQDEDTSAWELDVGGGYFGV